ncbi:DUF4276 family protein [Schaalia hyovaginalis]|uniref:DUF4276 family protein n=1 Tax=Schaalia hyovaginalis TaxID=29316 RepID=UPI001E5C5EC6|nr:DUF4276 family protein [Schaalia hyovaginalis]
MGVDLPKITSVVEGHGEVDALPVLLRRLTSNFSILVRKPHRIKRTEFTGRDGANAVRMQREAAGELGMVIVLLDLDDDDSDELRKRVIDNVGEDRVSVVLATKEFEAWFLAGVESLRSHSDVRDDATYDGDCESVRNAKGRLEGLMKCSYKETLHQAKFAACLDLELARKNSPSFESFCSSVEKWLETLG